MIDTLRKDSVAKKSSSILLVSHAMYLKCIMDSMMDGKFSDFLTLSHPPITDFPWATKNTTCTKVGVEFNLQDGKKAVVTVLETNSTKHLDIEK